MKTLETLTIRDHRFMDHIQTRSLGTKEHPIQLTSSATHGHPIQDESTDALVIRFVDTNPPKLSKQLVEFFNIFV